MKTNEDGKRIIEIYDESHDDDDIIAAEKLVRLFLHPRPKLNDNQFAAAVSFAVSLDDIDLFKTSKFVEAVNQAKNRRELLECCIHFGEYRYEIDGGKKKESDALISRRNEEAALYCKPSLKLLRNNGVTKAII